MPTFPSKAEFYHQKGLADYKRLYDLEHHEVFGIKEYFEDDVKGEKKLYIAANLPALISDYFSDMIVGDGLKIWHDDEKVDDELKGVVRSNRLDDVVLDLGLDQSIYGYSVLRVRTDEADEKKPIIEVISPDIYFPTFGEGKNMPPTQVVLASYLIDPMSKNTADDRYSKKLIYKTIYSKDPDNKVTLEYEVRHAKVDMTEGAKVDPAVYGTFYPAILQKPITLETDRIPVWQIDNPKRSGVSFGKSDYKDIKPLLDEINNRLTHISVQLIKHMNARLVVPADSLPDLGDEEGSANVVKTKDLEIIEIEKEDSAPFYLKNDNPLVEESFKMIDKLVRQALGIARVPVEMLEPDVAGGNLKVEAMKIRLFFSLRKVSRKRLKIKTVMQEVLEYALELAGVDAKDGVNVDFDDVLPTDQTELTRRMVERKVAGLVSARTAIEMMDDVSSDEAQTEYDKIQEEMPEVFPVNEI